MNQYIEQIREFNRYYTKVIGVVDKAVLGTEFSLAEARVIYELGNEQLSLKELNEILGMDYGYLSRMTKSFIEKALCEKKQSELDKRSNVLTLTDKGKAVYDDLTTKTAAQIGQLIGGLSENEKKGLVSRMQDIEILLSKYRKDEVEIRYDIRPGDIGYLIKMHGEIYFDECGYDHQFEAYVCHTFEEFLKSYTPEKERMWLACKGDQIVGSIAIVNRGDRRGQLRWFLIEPEFRGTGLGRDMLKTAMDYVMEKGFDSIFLETTEDQKKAIGMYKRYGFERIRETPVEIWGRSLVEETYELKLK